MSYEKIYYFAFHFFVCAGKIIYRKCVYDSYHLGYYKMLCCMDIKKAHITRSEVVSYFIFFFIYIRLQSTINIKQGYLYFP